MLTAALLGLAMSLNAEPAATTPAARTLTPLTGWDFTEDAPPDPPSPIAPPANAIWQTVTVPHIFRQSGLPDHTAGWYRHRFTPTAADVAGRVFLKLEGAASVTDVFVNDRHVGRHHGPFTAASFDLTPALRADKPNLLQLRVSNREVETENLLAKSVLFYLNGGLFRPAWLIKTGAVHIHPDLGSTGVYLTPRNITAARADLGIETWVRNSLPNPATVSLRHILSDPSGKVLTTLSTDETLAPDAVSNIPTQALVTHPRLWSLGHPALYTVRTELWVAGKLTDTVTERIGLRTIAWTDNRFLLNGQEVQFRGVDKHAQDEYAWNAVSDNTLREEWRWLSDMGVNAVRLAHYPHARLEYDIADEKGIAVWAENGLAGRELYKTPTLEGEYQTREMVRQNWNHPSILFWSSGNEAKITPATRFADVIRAENDPGRLVTYASDGWRPYNCDFIAHNTYHGWYGDDYTDFAELPTNALISETGAGDWLSHHVPYGTIEWRVDKFEPEEYAEVFTEYRLQTICHDDVARHPMFFWWNFREFYNLKFKKNRNTKGLLTLAGYPKDTAYLFSAFFNPSTPLVHLTGRSHFYRAFAADNGIKAYANISALELKINGVSQGQQTNGAYHIPDMVSRPDKVGKTSNVKGIRVNNVFFWKAPLTPGRNLVEVSDNAGHTDRMIVYQAFADGALPPSSPTDLVQELRSSNPASPAVYINRPVEAQLPFYTDVDGSSDNTFDQLPPELAGATWIGTRRLSDPTCKTDLSFRINPVSSGATIYVLFSTGSHPKASLKPDQPEVAAASSELQKTLASAGFKPASAPVVWRDHNLDLADASLWFRTLKPGESLNLQGHSLDYLLLLKPLNR